MRAGLKHGDIIETNYRTRASICGRSSSTTLGDFGTQFLEKSQNIRPLYATARGTVENRFYYYILDDAMQTGRSEHRVLRIVEKNYLFPWSDQIPSTISGCSLDQHADFWQVW